MTVFYRGILSLISFYIIVIFLCSFTPLTSAEDNSNNQPPITDNQLQNSDSFSYRIELAQVHIRFKKFDKVEPLLKQAEPLAKTDKKNLDLARAYGDFYRRSNQQEKALPYLEKQLALTKDPRQKGYLLSHILDKAENILRKVIDDKALTEEETQAKRILFDIFDQYGKLKDMKLDK